MLDVFDEIPFANPDGGAWKQGWNVQYPQDAFNKDKLLIFVMPHSHNDPGMFELTCHFVLYFTCYNNKYRICFIFLPLYVVPYIYHLNTS